MKNQYFGDINDYRKYGLLRELTGKGKKKAAVCWMLTPDDGSPEGKFIRYLHYPLLWNYYDAELYRFLHTTITRKGLRDVGEFEASGLLPSACFFSETIPDTAVDRALYFKAFMNNAQECDLIFYDPDNGIEVKSIPYGRKNSSKYLYWREIVASYVSGHSVLIYQHFPRIREVNRNRFIKSIAQGIVRETGAREVYSFRTAYVVFLLACWGPDRGYYETRIVQIASAWDRQFQIDEHC
jgi:hypothetical protein